MIPRVRVVRHLHTVIEDDYSKRCFLLKVSNPTLGSVRLRMKESKYKGEVEHWNHDIGGGSSSDTKNASVTTTTLFAGLLVDTLTQTVVRAELKPPLTNPLGTTATVTLLSAEDTIIELGGKARAVPKKVQNWDPDGVADNYDSDSGNALSTSFRLVAKSASDAWFELVVREGLGQSPSLARAIPLALEVDLGNGSWESSLIAVPEGVDNDKVTFDLVLVWT